MYLYGNLNKKQIKQIIKKREFIMIKLIENSQLIPTHEIIKLEKKLNEIYLVWNDE